MPTRSAVLTIEVQRRRLADRGHRNRAALDGRRVRGAAQCGNAKRGAQQQVFQPVAATGRPMRSSSVLQKVRTDGAARREIRIGKALGRYRADASGKAPGRYRADADRKGLNDIDDAVIVVHQQHLLPVCRMSGRMGDVEGDHVADLDIVAVGDAHEVRAGPSSGPPQPAGARLSGRTPAPGQGRVFRRTAVARRPVVAARNGQAGVEGRIPRPMPMMARWDSSAMCHIGPAAAPASGREPCRAPRRCRGRYVRPRLR